MIAFRCTDCGSTNIVAEPIDAAPVRAIIPSAVTQFVPAKPAETTPKDTP